MISWGLKTRGLRPIGLDIGHNSIKMIQLAIYGEQISVLAADEIRIDEAVKEVEDELGDRGRVLLRPSGTEPLVRVMVEGEDNIQVNSLAHSLAERVEQLIQSAA